MDLWFSSQSSSCMAELSSLYTIYRCSLTSDLCVTWWCCRLLLRQTPSSNPEGYIMIAVSRNVLIYSRCKFVLTWRKQKLKFRFLLVVDSLANAEFDCMEH